MGPACLRGPPGPQLGALRSGALQSCSEHSPAQRGRLLSRMAFQLSAHERSLRPGGCSCTCWLWQAVNRTCSQLGFGSAPVGREGAFQSSVMSPGAWSPDTNPKEASGR